MSILKEQIPKYHALSLMLVMFVFGAMTGYGIWGDTPPKETVAVAKVEPPKVISKSADGTNVLDPDVYGGSMNSLNSIIRKNKQVRMVNWKRTGHIDIVVDTLSSYGSDNEMGKFSKSPTYPDFVCSLALQYRTPVLSVTILDINDNRKISKGKCT